MAETKAQIEQQGDNAWRLVTKHLPEFEMVDEMPEQDDADRHLYAQHGEQCACDERNQLHEFEQLPSFVSLGS